MRGSIKLRLVVLLAAFAFLANSRANGAPAFFIEESIWNRTGQDVNDLHLVYKNGAVGNASVQVFGLRPRVQGDTNLAGTATDWISGKISVPDGRPADVFIARARVPGTNVAQPATIDFTKSYWTTGGQKIDGGFRELAIAPDMTPDVSNAVVTFSNPETQPIVYSNFRLWKNCPIGNLTLDSFDTPTGTQIMGLPPSITLSPGQSVDLNFGPADPSGYILALADATTVSDPNTVFEVSAATPVPEPGMLGLLLPAGVLFVRRRG